MSVNSKAVFQLLAVGVLVVFIVMMDRAMFRVDYAEICRSVQQASTSTSPHFDSNGYRYGPVKYATQVVPAIAPPVAGWSGETSQSKRILITGGAGFIG
jgi:hypothetical protein